MNDIVFITNFFKPEIGAASQRISTLAYRLAKDNFNVFVFTVWPLFHTGARFRIFDRKKNIKILRLPIYRTTSRNIILRALSMINFSLYLIIFSPFFVFSKAKNIFIQGHPLISSFFSVFIFKKILRKNIILNVSDLWPRSGLELDIFKKGFFYNFLESIEKFNYSNSDLIITQSKYSKNYIDTLLNHSKEVSVFYNVPEKQFQYKEKNNDDRLKIVYAGLLGHAQNIFEFCQNIDFKNHNIEFHIYGEGTQKIMIEKFINSGNNNIILNNFIDREDLDKVLPKYDIALVKLKKAIYGALPSKIFEYCSHSLPIIFVGEGEGKELINNFQLGWSFKSDDYNGINLFLKNYNLSIDEYNSMRKNINLISSSSFDYENQYNNFIKLLNKI